MFKVRDIGKCSYSSHRLHEKIALVSLLMKEMNEQQQQQHPESFFLSSPKKYLGTFSCDSLSCVSSNVQSKTKRRDANNNKNTNNNNNVSTSMADEQNHVLEFYSFDISHERHLNLKIDSNGKRLIIFYNISNGLFTIGIRNGK
ncbi:unnamed protein product [Rotaria socialis]|uniref:Uncharacterized protein n=1 Tax=Rotaria socialis TaxID=392032 RepID=A0A820HHD9_9BILA|nr:unnamed protein product [Rotaria socialis]